MSVRTISHESFRWLLLEGSMVVFSILLAFAIEAWWQHRQEESEERLVLQSVLDEFESLRNSARHDLRSAIAMRTSVRALLSQSSRSEGTTRVESPDALLADTTWIISPARYSAPVLHATVSSGQLSLVGDPDLRLQLGIWANELDDLELIMSRDSKIVFDRLLPIYGREGSLLQIIASATCQPGAPENCTSTAAEVPAGEKANNARMLASREIQGALVERMISLSDMIDFGLSGLDRKLGATVERLKARLDG